MVSIVSLRRRLMPVHAIGVEDRKTIRWSMRFCKWWWPHATVLSGQVEFGHVSHKVVGRRCWVEGPRGRRVKGPRGCRVKGPRGTVGSIRSSRRLVCSMGQTVQAAKWQDMELGHGPAVQMRCVDAMAGRRKATTSRGRTAGMARELRACMGSRSAIRMMSAASKDHGVERADIDIAVVLDVWMFGQHAVQMSALETGRPWIEVTGTRVFRSGALPDGGLTRLEVW